MRKHFLAAIMSTLIISLALGPAWSATEIRMTGMYTSSGLGVTGDHRLGNTCVVSTGGRTYCGLNASHLSFFADNAVSLELLYQFALASDNGVNGYCLKSYGDNTFYWGVCGTGGATTSLPWDNITGTDNALVPGKLKAIGTPDNTMVPYWDNSGQFRWAAPSGTGTPAGSTGQLQYNDNGAFGAIPGPGFDPVDNTTKFPGPVESADPGDGNRRITLIPNTTYTCAANENSVLMLVDNSVLKLAGCENGQLVAYHKDNVAAATPTLVTDNFNRADENPLDNGVWTTATGWAAMKIVSNVAIKSADTSHNLSYYSGATFASNQYAQAVRSGVGYVGLACRFNGDDGYITKVEDDTNFGAIYRIDNGTETMLGSSFTHSGASGETLRLECSGTTVTLKSNGSTVASRTDATYSSGSPGVYQYNSTANLDDFEGGDL